MTVDRLPENHMAEASSPAGSARGPTRVSLFGGPVVSRPCAHAAHERARL